MDTFIPDIIIFDLDRTIFADREPIDQEMADLFIELIRKTRVAFISSQKFERFDSQLLGPIGKKDENVFGSLFIFPNSGGSFFRYTKGKFGSNWEAIYERLLSRPDRDKIMGAFQLAIGEAGLLQPGKVYGEQFEERGCQITYSALGMEAPLSAKAAWDPDGAKRAKVANIVITLLPDFNVSVSGLTSIDVTPKDIDRSYGVLQIERYLGIERSKMLFVSDALLQGGAAPVSALPVKTTGLADVGDVRLFIKDILSRH